MADTENSENPTLTAKRKLDPFPISKYNHEEKGEENQNKYQKLQFHAHNDISAPNEENSTGNLTLEPSSTNCASNSSITAEKSAAKVQSEENAGADFDDEKVEEDDDDDDDDDDDGDFEDEEEEENGEVASVDRKGKGIMIEEEDDDSDDDEDDDSSVDGGSEVESDCNEVEDDPLAEVDLDNILPSRTRRRSVQTGVYIANDLDNNDNDDSDDSDA